MSSKFGEGKSSGKEVVSLTNDITKEMITGVINKCTKNEQINDDSKIIISNVLPNINFHNNTYSPKKKGSPPVYHNPKIEKSTSH
jgi:hypothetical protein